MFWDRVAGVYDIFANVINRKVHRELKTVVADMIEPSDDVLECACGTGMLSAVIGPRCKSLTATDYSVKMVEKAKKKCSEMSNVTVRVGNILSIDCPDERFDVVVAANVIHLLDEPEKALSEMTRVCKKDGLLIIPTYMNKDRTGKASAFSRTVGKAGADFKRQFTESNYADFFIQNGYTDIKVTHIRGRIPCSVAVIHPGNNLPASSARV